MLEIIAHIDLPGNYRLIRLESAALCQEIQAGDSLKIAALTKPIYYLRHQSPKIDCLFYITEENQYLLSGALILENDFQHYSLSFSATDTDTDTFRILVCPLAKLGQGLSLALNPLLQATISLFLFEINEASPFKLQPSQLYLPYMQAEVIANMALLEDKKIAARFYSERAIPGCFQGSEKELIALIKQNSQTDNVEIIRL